MVECIPSENRLSDKFSLHEIISRQKLNAKTHCHVPFGSYCEVHAKPDITNSMAPISHLAIALGPMGNIQGTYKFFA